MDGMVVSVTRCVEMLNLALQIGLPEVIVEGEVSGWRVSQDKWAFFDIKDDRSSLKCFASIFSLAYPVKDGMKVLVTARPQVHQKYGFSLVVEAVLPKGEGELLKSLEMLRSKLQAQGLFDDARKRPLPVYPERIGLITSSKAAAFHDVVTIIAKRWPVAHITLFDSSVQGTMAQRQLVAAIGAAWRSSPPLDCLLIVRGGGSLEDLSVFNAEPVVLAVSACRIPVISGIGHQTDQTLVDLVADVSATTPTNAAQIGTPDSSLEKQGLARAIYAIQLSIDQQIEELVSVQVEMSETIERRILTEKQLLDDISQRIRERLNDYFLEIDTLLAAASSQLSLADPTHNLRRGYSITRSLGGMIIRDNRKLRRGDILQTQLAFGRVKSEVTQDGS